MFQVLLSVTNNSMKYQSFLYTQLNDQAVLFLTIQFSISHLFAYSLNVKHLFDPSIGFYQVLPLRVRLDQEIMVMLCRGKEKIHSEIKLIVY